MSFPDTRMRRLRSSPQLRSLVREASPRPNQLIWPLFLKSSGETVAIDAMPGVSQYPLSEIPKLAESAANNGLGGVLLFGLPDEKDDVASGAYADDGVIQRAVSQFKESVPELLVVTDVCLCEYTSHGHCGLLDGETVDNDSTLELLARTAVSHAQAGADVVAPSDMMDGRVGVIRDALDGTGLHMTPIMSYAAKYASAFYGPFRQAADSAPQFGDRRAYQMDPANSDEAMKEIALDIEEGADIVMVKPGMPCLDIIRRCKDEFGGPVAAYQVSGEYSMIKFADRAGALDGPLAMLEAVTSMSRAGADIIITYAAPDLVAGLGS